MDSTVLEEKWQKKCDARHLASVRWRKEKAGKSHLKAYFYLGKFDKKKKEYATEKYAITLYDELVWRRFKKYCKKIEKSGIVLKRQWLESDAECCFYGTKKIFESPYRRHSFFWWKDIAKNICSMPFYKDKVCSFDYYDIYTGLIINLTIKGLYLGLHGISLKSKQQMHECWLIREKLLKAFKHDDFASYRAMKACEKKFGTAYKPEYSFDDESHQVKIINSPSKEIEDYYAEQYAKECMNISLEKEAFGELAEYINDLWD